MNALCQEANACEEDNTQHGASPHTAITKVTVAFRTNECTDCYVNCCIGGVPVNIFGNQVAALGTLALFERVDLLVAKDHLFKKSIILTMV